MIFSDCGLTVEPNPTEDLEWMVGYKRSKAYDVEVEVWPRNVVFYCDKINAMCQVLEA